VPAQATRKRGPSSESRCWIPAYAGMSGEGRAWRPNTAIASPHRDGRDGGAGSALYFQRLHDEGELVGALGHELVELEVFQKVHAVHHERDLVHRERELWIGIGRDLHRPVVGAEQHRVLADEPGRGLHADAGAGFHVARIVLAVELAPT